MNAAADTLPHTAAAEGSPPKSLLARALAEAQVQGDGPLADALGTWGSVLELLRDKRHEAALRELEEWQVRRAAWLEDERLTAEQAGQVDFTLPALSSRMFAPLAELERPELPRALAAMSALKRWSDVGAAREALAEALTLGLTRAEAHNLLGVLLAEEGDSKAAGAEFAAALEADAGHYRALTNKVALRLQDVGGLPADEQASVLEWAEAELRRSLAMQEEQHAAYQNLAVVLRQRGDREGSVAAARRASTLDYKRSNQQGGDIAKRALSRWRENKWLLGTVLLLVVVVALLILTQSRF